LKQDTRCYGKDIAYIHHSGFTRFANASAPELVSMFRAHRIDSGTIVDLGCGSGALARHLVDAGYDVIGIDISEEMIRIARRNVPEAKFRQASLLSTVIPRCKAVISIGECLNYLFDLRNNSKQRAKLFRRISQALDPGGIFVFDVATDRMQRARKTFTVGQDWVIAAEIIKQGDRLSREIVSARKIDEGFRLHHETHRQLLFQPQTLKRELINAGFQVKLLRGYGNLRFDAAHRGFVCHIRG
jgi:SAM-dependent methyltransferase